MIPVEGGQSVENIVLEGDGFGFAGTARLDNKTGLVSADIKDFSLRQGDSIAFKLAATATGYAIKASGAAFDVRGVISEATASVNGERTPDLSVEAEIGKLTGFNGETIADAKATFVLANGDPTRIAISGSLQGKAVEVNYTDSKKGASLRVSAEAGSILRFLDFYTRINGGTLSITADRQGPTGALTGKASIANFDVLNEPAVKQAISTAPARQPIDPTRLHFDQMGARFRLAGEAIIIDEALLRGQAVGATFNGRVDLQKAHVTINGTYLPAYAVNNAFGRLPLIGLVLGGGNRGGLIGVTFRVEGPLAGPRVYFNPLSAVAPGIFRKIFEFR